METQTDSEDNMPLALTQPRTPMTETHNLGKVSRPIENLASGDEFYRRAANRKNGKPYFNLVKDNVINSSDYNLT